jgi:hypothetical protein
VKEVLGGFPLALSPLVEIRLEEAFVELGHTSKSSSAVEEVELFVVLFVHLGLFSEVLFT